MADILEEAARIQGKQADLRSLKRELLKKMIKERKSQEEIDFCMKQMDDAKEGEKVYNEAIKKLTELGFAIGAQLIRTSGGSHIAMGLAPITFAQFQELKKTENA